jgi:hypothetical protein
VGREVVFVVHYLKLPPQIVDLLFQVLHSVDQGGLANLDFCRNLASWALGPQFHKTRFISLSTITALFEQNDIG